MEQRIDGPPTGPGFYWMWFDSTWAGSGLHCVFFSRLESCYGLCAVGAYSSKPYPLFGPDKMEVTHHRQVRSSDINDDVMDPGKGNIGDYVPPNRP